MVTSRAAAWSGTAIAPRWAALIVPIGVAGIVIANAWRGVMPGLGFWDTGEFQTVLPIMGTAHPTGYPTYVLLGFIANILLAPLGEPAFRINVLSLIAIATAAGVTVALVRRLTGSTILGAAAGLGLALTPVVWANATRADPHPIHLAFVAILLLTLVTWEQKRLGGAADADRWLVASAVVFGLAAGNHSLTLLLAIPIGLFVLATEPRIVLRGRFVLLCALSLVLTVGLVYLELPVRAGILRAPLVYAAPNTWDGFWYIALAEQFRSSLGNPLANLGDKLGVIGDLAWTQLGLLTVALPPAFLAAVRIAPRYALLTGSAMLITLIFNTSYSNADIHRYYLGPILWAWTWLALLAAFVVQQIEAFSPNRRAALVAAAVGAILLVAPGISAAPLSRDQADRTNDTAARLWLDATLETVDPGAVVVSWGTTSTPLWYGQHVQGLRPDIFIVDDRTMLDLRLGNASDVIDRYLDQRPVYVVRANPHDLSLVLERFDIVQVLDHAGRPIGGGSTALYQVVGRRGG